MSKVITLPARDRLLVADRLLPSALHAQESTCLAFMPLKLASIFMHSNPTAPAERGHGACSAGGGNSSGGVQRRCAARATAAPHARGTLDAEPAGRCRRRRGWRSQDNFSASGETFDLPAVLDIRAMAAYGLRRALFGHGVCMAVPAESAHIATCPTSAHLPCS